MNAKEITLAQPITKPIKFLHTHTHTHTHTHIYIYIYIYIYKYIPTAQAGWNEWLIFLSKALQVWIQIFPSRSVAIPTLKSLICPIIYPNLRENYHIHSHSCYVKFKQPHVGFEHCLLCLFSTTVPSHIEFLHKIIHTHTHTHIYIYKLFLYQQKQKAFTMVHIATIVN